MINFYILISALIVSGCGSKRNGGSFEVPEFSQFKNVKDSPEIIRNASLAVMKVSLASRTSGTGFFSSESGVFITNNHVLGSDNCGREGCFIVLEEKYQIGDTAQSHDVYAEPLFISPELDVAVYQIWRSSAQTEKFISPHFLRFSEALTNDLVGEKAYVVGHPHGHLKKFSKGRVYRTEGSWLYLTNFILPGNSGSPIIDSKGQVIGIIHRSNFGLDQIRKDGVNTIAIGSLTSGILRALEPRSGKLRGDSGLNFLAEIKTGEISRTEILKQVDVFLNSRTNSLTLTESADQQNFYEILANECEEKLLANNFDSLDTFYDSFKYCPKFLQLIECDSDKQTGNQICPKKNEQKKFHQRFELIASRLQQYQSNSHYFWTIVAPTRFETSQLKQQALGRRRLTNFLKFNTPSLDPEFAYYLARYYGDEKDLSYEGEKIRNYLKNFKNIEGYQYDAGNIMYANSWLMNYNDFSDHLKKIMSDNKVSLGDKLLAEAYAYQIGYFTK